MLVRTRSLAALTGAALTGVALAAGSLAAPAVAQPSGAPVDGRTVAGVAAADLGRGVEADVLADPTTGEPDHPADPPGPLAPGGGTDLHLPASYPHQPELRVFPPNDADATERNGTISHADLAPRLTELMERSDRVSTQVVGKSTEGRDLYLVTVTAPERRSETARQAAWREEIKGHPGRAARDDDLRAGYKAPIWFSANIHGDEWEGTDAALRIITHLASADDDATRHLLEQHRIVFSLTLNPDGRTHATRSTSLGLDANRDMITLATPEARSYVRTARAVQPLFTADFHGYTDVLQVEPAGPPHGENYEYDLFLPHSYAIARQVEDDVVAAEIDGNTYYDPDGGGVVGENTGFIKIPYRDTPSGWDDYPPVFTAQYASLHGAVTSTVELPLGPTGRTTTRADAAVNTEVAVTTMTSMIDYVHTRSDAMLADQIELFRRGAAGAPKVALTTENVDQVPGPDEWKQLWDAADDQEAVRLPRAYVLPVGPGQRSASDAEDLVDALLFHGIEVERLAAPAQAGGTSYPAGSYVVDLHQPLRGLASSLLALGSDISGKVPVMYDIAAWSPAYLWGATVDRVGSTTDGPIGRTSPVRGAGPRGSVPPGARYAAFDVAGVRDHRALNDLLGQGVAVRLTADGRAVVGPRGLRAAREAADRYRLVFATASRAEYVAAERAEDLTVAYAGNQDDRLSLLELGFDDLLPVSAAGIEEAAATGGATGLDDADVLWVGSSLDLPPGSAGHDRVRSWLRDGGAIVGSGAGAFAAAAAYGLVSGSAVTGDPAANGIIATGTPGEVLDDHAQDHGFVYPAVWFADLGAGTATELTYGSFLAGHWPRPGVADGQRAAVGQAAAVSGRRGQARAFVFGTSVFFRTHPRGGLSQAATAIHWAAP
ncbi:Zinc carboxypeptidase [Promicromonospora umidemergens]|uniref:M14 family zinc carboxypeptidase n=1 Tax=Promicromonospora umidemergens TaxID=629679 RepID=A0ABP8X283_9MICO|nr:M14 family zinc carboxypeptidase [Promicromonospora umidemergens]MCP2285041.1 Zinc carboxypeptidase [Promicromonospora umidemergens]